MLKILQIFQKMKKIWYSLVLTVAPYMNIQRSPLHFEFFGIDIICDDDGGCWMIEANR